ncbi:MAG: hypothetical protein ACTSR5_03405 [Promethearchaeota archaeon]
MKSISWFLVISYFDQVIGPSILYCNKELNEIQHIDQKVPGEVLNKYSYLILLRRMILKANILTSLNF